MNSKRVSVIIPAYNQAEFIGDGIQSVLNQTFQDFELIIVDDASPDNTSQVVERFEDRRIQYIVHKKNKMLAAARNTGIRASTGEIIALLDADDYFHPEKLEKHVAYLDSNPSVGVTYNSRFNLNHSQNTICELVRPPVTVGLMDLVMGFPFAPSDMVVRRDWLFQVGLFDETFIHFSEDLDINCQLAMAGCKFASVDKALNYRRYHSGRIIRNISERLNAAIRSLQKTFSDPRCSQKALAMQEMAFLNVYLAWAPVAFMQGETELGREYVGEVVRRDPSVLIGKPCALIQFFVHSCIADENIDHVASLQNILAQLPKELEQIKEQYAWAVAHGYLLKAVRAIMWQRPDDGRIYFKEASNRRAEVDDDFIGRLAHQLLSYENEFGSSATHQVISELTPYLNRLGGRRVTRQLSGIYSFNLAFKNFRARNYKDVFNDSANAFFNQPRYLGNRGIWSILLRSISKQAL